MTDEQGTQARTDFFISYTSTNRTWAEWIAWQLEAAGYSTIIQAWDFRPGFNFVDQMEQATTRAERTLLVLSPAYLTSDFTFAEWAAAFRRDPRGKQGTVLPVRIEACELKGLLGPIGYIDLVDLNEHDAREQLLAGVLQERAKPLISVPFPDSAHPSGPLRERPAFPGSLPPIWTIPYPQNPFFTGREEVLAELATSLQRGQPTALSQPQAISGLGGIGKTQLTIEYAYRHHGDYQAVLWVQADTRENLTSSYLTIAALLNLPERGEQESARVITAVKNWLQRNTSWLLILDNADELALVQQFLPPSSGGHVLLTTRAQATGRFARCLQVDILSIELGALFLLRRAGRLAPDATLEQASDHDRNQARAICKELGGLPLALDQAGAYIEETRCALSDYLPQYQTRQAVLLQRRGGVVSDHPEPVATTWSLSFERVERANPAAADVLRLCAFLSPDAIPEEVVVAGIGLLALPEKRNKKQEKRGWLPAFLFRKPESTSQTHTLSMHRLVQAVLKDQMNEQSRRQWAQRAVQVVNAVFPRIEHQTWPQCDRLLPHALVCAELIAQEQMTFPEATRLLNQAGYYLEDHARYTEAEPLYQRALTICEQQLGALHPHMAFSLNNLAGLYRDQGKYKQAEPLYQLAVDVSSASLGLEHPQTQHILMNFLTLLSHIHTGGDLEALLRLLKQETQDNDINGERPQEEYPQ